MRTCYREECHHSRTPSGQYLKQINPQCTHDFLLTFSRLGLKLEEIQEQIKKPNPGSISGRILYFQFEQKEDLGVGLTGINDIQDFSGNGYHGECIDESPNIIDGQLNLLQAPAIFNVGMAIAAVQVAEAGVYIAMSGQVFEAGKVRKNRDENRFEAL